MGGEAPLRVSAKTKGTKGDLVFLLYVNGSTIAIEDADSR
jgi:hypothetical protein